MKRLRPFLFFLGLITGLLLLLYQLGIGLINIDRNSFQVLNWGKLVLGLLSTFIVILVQMFNWKMIMKGLGVPLTYPQVLRGYLMSFLPRYIPGTVWGYLGRSEWLYRSHSVQYRVSNLGSFLEILVAFISGIIIVAIWQLPKVADYKSVLIIFSIILLPLVIWWLMIRIGSRTKRFRWLEKMLPAGSLDKFSLSDWLLTIGIFLAQWMIYGLSLWFIAGAFSIENIDLLKKWVELSASFSLAWMCGFLVFIAPAGVGFRETVLIALLNFQFGSLTIATIAAIIARIFLSVSELLGIFVGLVIPKESE